MLLLVSHDNSKCHMTPLCFQGSIVDGAALVHLYLVCDAVVSQEKGQ